MNSTTTTHLIHHGTIARAEYVARVNKAAGTDIDILESSWIAALADEDFVTAERIEKVVIAARRAAGLR
jgi:phosphosulfolactate phosphohydrolase-like enzyme